MAPEAPQKAPGAPEVKRDIVKTASMTLTAGDPGSVADEAAKRVDEAGGRVDSRSENAGSTTGRARVSLVLRVPADKLDGVLTDLEKLGTVETVQVSTDDVTGQRVDLDARIKALQTSVDRLLAIMRDARDPEALIKAEDALAQRQADLDSLRAQRTALGEQIDYSTINLEVYATQVGGPTKQYRGFFGQVERGWDALMSMTTHSVLLFGFLLPWLGALAVVAGLGYGLSRVLKRGGKS